MFYPKKKHKINVKYNKIIQLISTLKINHILLHFSFEEKSYTLTCKSI